MVNGICQSFMQRQFYGIQIGSFSQFGQRLMDHKLNLRQAGRNDPLPAALELAQLAAGPGTSKAIITLFMSLIPFSLW